MATNVTLTPEEIRILGCLLEKSVVTPDQYPLTLNGLTNACNQKSSREPVMSLEPGFVARTARQLEEKHLVTSTEGKSSVTKYTHRFCNTLLSKIKLDKAEFAIITLLFLRGPQTPGELRARSGRLYAFKDNTEVKKVLQALMEREEGAMVARMPRKPGRQDHEYQHLFAGEIDSVEQEPEVAERESSISQRESEVAALEARVARLEQALRSLAERLGEPIDL